MKAFGLITVLSLLSFTITAQSNNWAIDSKASCAADVIVYCSGSDIQSFTIQPNTVENGSCPSGEYPCSVKIVISGNTEIIEYNGYVNGCGGSSALSGYNCWEISGGWQDYFTEYRMAFAKL